MNSLKQEWLNGDPLQAGRIIAATIPVEAQPAWALRCLNLMLTRSQTHTVFSHIQELVLTRRYSGGHEAFSRVRQAVLALEASDGSGAATPAWALHMAELVAKLAYNASKPNDPFDEDTADWVADHLRRFAAEVGDPSFEEGAWNILLVS